MKTEKENRPNPPLGFVIAISIGIGTAMGFNISCATHPLKKRIEALEKRVSVAEARKEPQ